MLKVTLESHDSNRTILNRARFSIQDRRFSTTKVLPVVEKVVVAVVAEMLLVHPMRFQLLCNDVFATITVVLVGPNIVRDVGDLVCAAIFDIDGASIDVFNLVVVAMFVVVVVNVADQFYVVDVAVPLHPFDVVDVVLTSMRCKYMMMFISTFSLIVVVNFPSCLFSVC